MTSGPMGHHVTTVLARVITSTPVRRHDDDDAPHDLLQPRLRAPRVQSPSQAFLPTCVTFQVLLPPFKSLRSAPILTCTSDLPARYTHTPLVSARRSHLFLSSASPYASISDGLSRQFGSCYDQSAGAIPPPLRRGAWVEHSHISWTSCAP